MLRLTDANLFVKQEIGKFSEYINYLIRVNHSQNLQRNILMTMVRPGTEENFHGLVPDEWSRNLRKQLFL